MINYPVTYHPGFLTDLLPLEEDQKKLWAKAQKVALAALPLLGLYRPFRGALTVGFSAARSVMHIYAFSRAIQSKDSAQSALHFFHATLATAAVGLFFLNPVLSYLASTTQDLAIQVQELTKVIRASDELDYFLILEKLAFITLDLLFIASFCYGAIEITVAFMALQVVLDFYISAKHIKKGEYIEGACTAILGGAHFYNATAQCKLLRWTYQHGGSEFTAELKQNSKGFVYLDIPDEHVRELFDVLGENGSELPPYFGKNRAGAHISVILSKEKVDTPIHEIGQKFTFRVVQADTIAPAGFTGDKTVSFVSVACPELEKLRSSYGLSSRIEDTHDFHITYAVGS